MKDNVLAEYPIPLDWHWKKRGSWMNIRQPNGIQVYISPLEKVDGKSPLFGNLKEVFKYHLIKEYKIQENGMLYFLSPPGFKFGPLLGDIARIYDILYEKEEYNRGYTKAVQK